MLIGEGPGADEDRLGRPFVGAAGRLLDLGLDAFGLTGEIIHIANIVKCRPPGNRVPNEEEMRACRPLLAAQFRFVRPKIIVLLGATAFHSFTGSTEGITKARGKWIEKNGYLILPTLHPAYILRSGRERIHLWNDLASVRNRLEEMGLAPSLAGRTDSDSANTDTMH
jgi:uracil-DNA glycosylase family 4